MIWVDREVKKIKELKNCSHWVDDMKTPSGRIHVGALRGVVIHDLIYKVLRENEVEAKFTYIFDNFDVMDGLPTYLDKSIYEKYMGMPLCHIPSPEKGYKSFADYYAEDFRKVFEKINCHPEILYSEDLYKSGRMDNAIKQALDKADIVREVYKEVANAPKSDDWFPFAPICDKCGKIGTTTTYKWDGENVYYRCEENKVKWAKGCGHVGKKSPFKGGGKLVWKLEWPGKFKTLGITIEGAGKDHMSKGGSYDMAVHLLNKVYNYPVPYNLPYEWFVIGGRKMSSSKGVGCAACDIAETLPADILRFLIVRTPIGSVLDFNPEGDTILNLFDDYDKCLNAYFDKIENKIPTGKKGEVLLDFARISELSQVKEMPEKRIYLPRFRTIISLIKAKTDIESYFKKILNRELLPDERSVLEERIVYANIYLEKYATSENKVEFLEKIPASLDFDENQKAFLDDLKNNLKENLNREELQNIIFTTLKSKKYLPKQAFSAFYKIMIGKEVGPKAADLILDIGIKKTIDRLSEV